MICFCICYMSVHGWCCMYVICVLYMLMFMHMFVFSMCRMVPRIVAVFCICVFVVSVCCACICFVLLYTLGVFVHGWCLVYGWAAFTWLVRVYVCVLVHDWCVCTIVCFVYVLCCGSVYGWCRACTFEVSVYVWRLIIWLLCLYMFSDSVCVWCVFV